MWWSERLARACWLLLGSIEKLRLVGDGAETPPTPSAACTAAAVEKANRDSRTGRGAIWKKWKRTQCNASSATGPIDLLRIILHAWRSYWIIGSHFVPPRNQQLRDRSSCWLDRKSFVRLARLLVWFPSGKCLRSNGPRRLRSRDNNNNNVQHMQGLSRLKRTPFVPNYKWFQEFWRAKSSQSLTKII